MQCSGSQHPSSSPVEGAGRARVSAPPASWCHALVATRVVHHHNFLNQYGLILMMDNLILTTITFEGFMSYLIYNVLKILWLRISTLESKHDHLSIRCLWCPKCKDYIPNNDMN